MPELACGKSHHFRLEVKVLPIVIMDRPIIEQVGWADAMDGDVPVFDLQDSAFLPIFQPSRLLPSNRL